MNYLICAQTTVQRFFICDWLRLFCHYYYILRCLTAPQQRMSDATTLHKDTIYCVVTLLLKPLWVLFLSLKPLVTNTGTFNWFVNPVVEASPSSASVNPSHGSEPFHESRRNHEAVRYFILYCINNQYKLLHIFSLQSHNCSIFFTAVAFLTTTRLSCFLSSD